MRRTALRTAPAAAPADRPAPAHGRGSWPASRASCGRASSKRNKFTPLDSRSTMSLRRLSAWSGSAPAAIACSRPGSIASNACLRGRRAQRPRLARAPVGDVPRRRCRIGEAHRRSSSRKNVGIVRQSPAARRAPGRRRSRRRARHAGCKQVEQLVAARQAREAARHCRAPSASAGSMWVCASSTICTPVLDRPQQPVGLGQRRCAVVRVEPPGRDQRGDRIERRRRAHRRDRGRRGSSAGSGRRIRPRECRRGRA